MTHDPTYHGGEISPWVECSCGWRWFAFDVRELEIAFGHHRIAANGKVTG